MTKFLTDRTRIEVYQRCQRERLLEFHTRGLGIRKATTNIYTSTGSFVHKGVELILKGTPIEEAVKQAITYYVEECVGDTLEVDEGEDQQFVFREQLALGEVLIRLFYEIRYHKLLNEYKVLGAEEEIEVPLSDNITLMSKPDAVFKDVVDGSLVGYGLKTASQWNETNEKQFKYDNQGIGEIVAIEHKYKEEVERYKMEFLIKGSRKFLKGAGRRIQNTYLVHPYMMDTGLLIEYSLDFTRTKGFNIVNIWDHSTPREWVQWLVSNKYDNLVGSLNVEENKNRMLISPYPYNRSLEDIENWKEQVVAQETDIANKLDILTNTIQSAELVGARESSREYRTWINRAFPQNRKSCFSYSGYCQFVDVCWNGVRTDSGDYCSRKPHHQGELVQISKGE